MISVVSLLVAVVVDAILHCCCRLPKYMKHMNEMKIFRMPRFNCSPTGRGFSHGSAVSMVVAECCCQFH